MIWHVIKKQALTFTRNRQHLMLLIGLPLILISILSMALGGLMSGETTNLDIKVAMTKIDENQQIDRFIDKIDAKNISDREKEVIIKKASETKVITPLVDNVFEQLEEQIELELIEKDKVESVKSDNSYAAIIEIPETFTYDLLQHMYLDINEQPSIDVLVNEEKELGAQVVISILEEFKKEIAFSSVAMQEGIDLSTLDFTAIEVEAIAKDFGWVKEPVDAKEYYTIGMAVMNVLFIASTIGSYAYREKRTHVFNRIIVADIPRWKYFLGIYLSTIVFAFIQLIIILIASRYIFNVTFSDPLGVFIVSLALASAVGGVGVLLTAISYRMDSEVLTNYFQSIIVSIFAFLGGSFIPTGGFSPFFRLLGDLTPNGAGLSAYLFVLRGGDVFSSFILKYVIYLILFSAVLTFIGVFLFPKRGQVS